MTTTILRINQQQFCHWIDSELTPTQKEMYILQPHFSRAFLRSVAIKNGMAWAPAWIVKDKSRVTTRGIYSVPEYSAYASQFVACTATATLNGNSTT